MKMSAKFAFFMVALLQGYSANAERIFSDRLGGSLNVHSANTNKNSQERSHTSSKKEQNRIGREEEPRQPKSHCGIMLLRSWMDCLAKKVLDDDDDDVVPVPASTTPAPVVNAIEKWCVDNFSKTVATCSKLENQNCYPGFTGYKLCERVFQRKCKRANPCCEARNATNGKVELECAPKPSISKAAAEIP
eukprot:TRINITY_DN10411_c0_g1_i2.p1 TRINITY_DN10411_c0_g1~~TRINITY_DN10411_c0_g1_i2.p1  ORF type:complete len:190 (+),score=34.75 TRINITY_DN10411_c0_g1_i2:106-675(+)